MKHKENPFRKAGLALLAFGALDIGFMIWAVANDLGYSSSFNIFAIILGVLLIKGNAGIARVVRWFSVFLGLGLLGFMVVYPLGEPVDLMMIRAKMHPGIYGAQIALTIAFAGLLAFMYRELSTQAALDAMAEAGYRSGRPFSAVLASIALFAFGLAFMFFLSSGESAMKAKRLAEEKVGPGYEYHVTRMNFYNDSGSAKVIAYKEGEVRGVRVEW